MRRGGSVEKKKKNTEMQGIMIVTQASFGWPDLFSTKSSPRWFLPFIIEIVGC
jgi:hypothetical protein